MKALFFIAATFFVVTGAYNVLCLPESTPSLYQRLIQADCEQLAASFNPTKTNVSTVLFPFFDKFPANTTTWTITLREFVAQYQPNMVISSNVLLYDPVKTVAAENPATWFLMTSIETRLNDPIPANMIWLEFYLQIVWYLKGVLAAQFSATVSSTNDFIIHVPQRSGLFVMPTNFYYAGLKSVNPNANLTAIIHFTFGRDADQLVQRAGTISPTYLVFAHFGSQTYYTGNLSAAHKYEIANALSVNSPAEDYDVWQNANTTLAFHILNMPPVWKGIVVDGRSGEDLTGRFDIVVDNAIYLSDIAPFVPKQIARQVKKLENQYLRNPNFVGHSLFCEPSVVQTMKEIFPVPNGCLTNTQLVEGSLLHPNINIDNWPV